MKLLSKIISSFFGAGYFPVAPGTLTSLVVILAYKFYLFRLSWSLHLLILFLLFFIGIYASTKVESESRKKDPRKIVIDEACGQLLVLFRMGDAWFPILSGFLLFRIFDIIKPYPIKKVETLPSGWGIMMDDIVAAIYAGVIINLYLIIK
ncbi:MAG: phosphatidylglycerophosphatase A [Candidatus Aminicenantes bacterium]|nr:MAG: phosphatidylglycerophosphatase A [Candidatus Aminicenantes bacterium]